MLVIDRNLYFRSDVKALIDYLNEKLVIDVEWDRMPYQEKGIELMNLAIDVTTCTGQHTFFSVPALHPHNAEVLIENVLGWLEYLESPAIPAKEKA